MSKHQRFGAKAHSNLENIFPPGIDAEAIASFFDGKGGVSDEVLDAIEAALDSDTNGIGIAVSAAARGTVQETETGPIEEDGWTYLETHGDHFLAHDHGQDHGEEDGVEASGKGTNGRGNKLDEGTSTNGNGKGKGKIKEQPTPEPDPDAETELDPVQASDPVPEPDPVQASDPVPEPDPVQAPAAFGWLDDNTYLSGGDTPDGFNLELSFNGAWTDQQKQIGAEQAELLSNYIIGDLADNASKSLDDIRIEIYQEELSGGAWGRGGWTSLGSDGMVDEGRVRLDTSSLDTAVSWSMLDELFLHEMLHAIGWGTTWSQDNLVENGYFVGETAMAEYGGPIAVTGGHLAESVGDEMGTPYFTQNQTVSDLTLAILEDMGFETTYSSETLIG